MRRQAGTARAICGARKRARRKRHSPARAITIILCLMIGVFYSHHIADGFEPTTPPSLHINSANAVLTNFESGAVLLDKNGEERIYPASLTKIMTAVIVLEHVDDLQAEVLLDEAMFQPIYEGNAAMAGFLPGESVRVIDLLYGLLLPSGAECAVGLAEYVAGTESTFVDLMNKKARELGMSGSNFTNTTGLHDNDHYATAHDLAVLFRYALADNTFYTIITSAQYATPATNWHDDGITLCSTLLTKISSPQFEGGLILGGKTGYTEEAGQCLASLAEKDGNRYILVTCGAQKNRKSQNLHFDDAIAVYNAIH